jgi:hypothetical protein
MPRPTPDEVRATLASFGTKIENFNQSDPGRAFKDRRLTDGYCEGVSLDWIRRVLQGGRPSFSPQAKPVVDSNPEHIILRKKQSQAARQAYAFLNWSNTKQSWQDKSSTIKEAHMAKWNRDKDEMLDKLERLEGNLLAVLSRLKASESTVELTPTILAEIKECFGISLGSTQDADKVERLYNDTIPKKKTSIKDTKPDTKEILRGVHREAGQRAWKDLVSTADKEHPKKRSFSNISLVASLPTQQNLELDGVITQLRALGQNHLKSGMAVKINIGGSQESTKFFHSTASYLTPEGEYLFLDPNYGIFAYSEWVKGVMKAILYLYQKVYCWVEGTKDRQVPIRDYDLQIEIFKKADS